MKKKFTHAIKKVFVLILLLSLSFPLLTPSTASAAEEKTVLKVAFPQVKGFSETDENGIRSGLIVDYLNEISKYTNWEYEYIDTDSLELMEHFLDGDFDLVGGTYYSETLEQYFAYPEYNTGYTKAFLMSRQNDYRLKSYNLQSLNGKKSAFTSGPLKIYADFGNIWMPMRCSVRLYLILMSN